MPETVTGALVEEMISILESIAKRDYVMEREFGQTFAARVRRVVKEARDG